MNIQHISVMGSGVMGSQIGLVAALAGFDVHIYDVKQEPFDKAQQELLKRLDRRAEKGKLTKADKDAAWERITWTTSLDEAVEQTDYVIEAVVENVDIKRSLFEQIDGLAPAHAILATNSSTIVSSKIADATNRADKVCNFHFFNPALVMEMVEVVKGPHTSQETADLSMELAGALGKTPILLKKEISGFIANRILGKLMNEALYLYENDYATAEEIDLACTKALNHPIGPFALIDLTGLDIHYHVRKQRFEESGDESDRPARIIEEKVNRGELGRKTGKGFYSYK